MGVYTYPKIYVGKLGSSKSTVERLSYWVCITGKEIHLAKLESFLALHTFIFKLQLESIHSTVESMSYWVCIYSRKIHVGKLGSSNSTVELHVLLGVYIWQENSPCQIRVFSCSPHFCYYIQWVCIPTRKFTLPK